MYSMLTVLTNVLTNPSYIAAGIFVAIAGGIVGALLVFQLIKKSNPGYNPGSTNRIAPLIDRVYEACGWRGKIYDGDIKDDGTFTLMLYDLNQGKERRASGFAVGGPGKTTTLMLEASQVVKQDETSPEAIERRIEDRLMGKIETLLNGVKASYPQTSSQTSRVSETVEQAEPEPVETPRPMENDPDYDKVVELHRAGKTHREMEAATGLKGWKVNNYVKKGIREGKLVARSTPMNKGKTGRVTKSLIAGNKKR